jgi:enoyl-CoA hydratase/carnithine racemase
LAAFFLAGLFFALLPALAGLSKAREMLYLGERYGADELERAGVAWRVVDDAALMGEAQAVAEKLAGGKYDLFLERISVRGTEPFSLITFFDPRSKHNFSTFKDNRIAKCPS